VWSDGVAPTTCPQTLRTTPGRCAPCDRRGESCPGCGRRSVEIGDHDDQEVTRARSWVTTEYELLRAGVVVGRVGPAPGPVPRIDVTCPTCGKRSHPRSRRRVFPFACECGAVVDVFVADRTEAT
jgi:hypothetical protein